jgi:fluoroquinolone transport system ATP-binding protein
MVEIQNLHFTYPKNESKTLKGLNFEIADGEIFGFLGPSGAGKSTTQNILIGILKKYAGSVRVMGQELKTMNRDYYENIGVAFEFPNFYSKFTALENLNYFKSMYSNATADPLELLDMVGIKEDAETRVANFSKGMKMRLNFCRAFLNNPKMVFLDEPTSGLDPNNAKKIKDIILQKQNEGVTIFLTTHNMHVADDLCDRVGFIVDGRIELIDSPRDLKVREGRKKVRVEYRENGHVSASEFDLNRLAENSDFLSILNNKQIETIHTQEATLEDVFIKTTGRTLR